MLGVGKRTRVGTQLIDECLMWMHSQGAHRVKLQMYDWNEQVRHVYEKKGFRPYAVSLEKMLD